MNLCCNSEAARAKNCVEIERRPVTYGNGDDAGVLVVYECATCKRKHYVHEVKAFEIGVKGE